MRRRHLAVWVATCVGAGIGRWAVAQTAPPVAPPASSPPASSPGAATTAGTQAAAQPFTAVQLDQLLAPIALYPDALLAQTLMAATYPLEVVEAARWSQDNPTLKGDAALAAVKDKGWDVSVTSLAAFPQVLAMMNSKLDWVQKVGDAMIAQQSDVAASIQRLRAQAQSAGNLKSTPQQTVTTQAASAGAPADTPAAIVIQPTNPDTVYVPSYNPSWAYGTWPYPNDPPIYFPPPPGYGYGYGGPGWSGLSFGLGFAVGGAFFGGWSWGGGWGGGWGWRGWGGWGHNSYTTINVTRATYITNNFNRNYYHDDRWNHDPAHRHGVPYRDQGSRERYGHHHPDAAPRQAFRGKIDGDPRGAGEHRDNENRGNEGRAGDGRNNEGRNNDSRNNDGRHDGDRGNDGHGGWNRAGDNRGGDHRGGENRDRGYNHAFGNVNHGRTVQHEAARGHSYANHASYHRGGGGGRGGGRGGRR